MITMLTKNEMLERLLNIAYTDGAIFSVVFIKRTNGELRKMVCRRGVKKHLAGGELKYNARDHKLLPVFDMQKQDYRCISCDSVVEVEYRGETYRVQE